MSYQVKVFSDLIKSYPTWESLQNYLTTPEGGQIRCVGEGRYRVLRYVKGVSDIKVPHGKWMRSVIWDTEEHLPVCVAPPKAEKGDVPVSRFTPSGEDSKYPLVERFVDGIMINAFRTHDNPDTLQIATRTQIGAGGKFYSEKTFEQMFDEALQSMGMSRRSILNQMANPTEMVPSLFASFVLEHPEHRVVARSKSARLWIVHTGSVHDDGLVSMNDDPTHWSSVWRIPQFLQQQKEAFKSEKNFADFFQETCKTGWYYQGITVKDGQGNRWRVRNPNYMYLRSLRGSEASGVDRFLRLRSESKVTEYLKHYNEDRQAFWDFEQNLRKATQEVFAGYCAVHKSREKKLEDLAWAVKPCVFKLHSHYLEHLRPNNEKVQMNHAVQLVNNLALYEQKRLLTPATSQAAA